MKIQVTQKDIDRSVKIIESKTEILRKDWNYHGYKVDTRILCTSCPISLAVKRKLRKKVNTDSEAVEVLDGNFTLRVLYLPKEARKFISDFDHGKNVKPIKFEALVGH